MSSYFLRKASPDEDAVTGLLADLLRAYPEPALLAAILHAARGFPGHTPFGALAHDHVDVEPWPSWKCGEPDLVLVLRTAGEPVHILVVEAKLGAPKSGNDETGADAPETTRDQLAKYHREAAATWPTCPISVVYLTHHAAPPVADLDASARALLTHRAQGMVPRLASCSWHDVEEGLREAVARRRDRAFAIAAEGLADVLRHVGMHHFTGRWMLRRPLARRRAPLWWTSTLPPRRDGRYRWSPAGIAPLAPPRRVYRWSHPSRISTPTRFYEA